MSATMEYTNSPACKLGVLIKWSVDEMKGWAGGDKTNRLTYEELIRQMQAMST